MTKDVDIERVQSAVDGLSEHFDSVQIFVTRHDSDEEGTVNVNLGAGNWFARYGQVDKWVARQKNNFDGEGEEEES